MGLGDSLNINIPYSLHSWPHYCYFFNVFKCVQMNEQVIRYVSYTSAHHLKVGFPKWIRKQFYLGTKYCFCKIDAYEFI